MATKVQEATFNPGASQEIDQETILTADPTLSGKQFPTIQWVNGRKEFGDMAPDSLNYNGGFLFVVKTNSTKKYDQLTDEELAARKAIADALTGFDKSPWKATKYTFHDGTVAEGVWARQMGVTACLRRRAWSAVNDADEHKYFPWDDYKGAKAYSAVGKNPSSKTQVLVQVKNAESVASLMLTFSGTSGKNFDDILVQFQNSILTAANAKAKEWAEAQKPPVQPAKFAPRSFYIAIGADRNEDGSPKFTPVGSGKDSSTITPPVALFMPEKAADVTSELLAQLQVPAEILKQGSAIVADNLDWAKAWDSFDYSGSPAKPDAEPQESVEEQISGSGAAKLESLGI